MLRTCLAALALASGSSVWANFPNGVIDQRTQDFGIVPRGQQLVHYFRVVNPTSQPIRISNVRVSCGCVTAKALDTVVAPGKESAIWAHMDGRRFQGHKVVTVYVTFSEPRFDEIRLVVQAQSRDDLFYSADSLALGKIPFGAGKTGAMQITVYNGQVRFTDVKSDSSFVKPTLKEVKRQGSETVYEVAADIRQDTPAGIWFTDVWVTTDNAGMTKLRVPVNLEIEKAVEKPAPKIEPKATAQAAKDTKVSGTKPVEAKPAVAPKAPTPTAPPASAPAPPVSRPAVSAPTSERASVIPFVGFFRR